jgi:hypothetical protein
MNILTGNSAARKAAEQSAAAQKVANDRQLAELRASENRTRATRRNPRGRRLFVSDATQKSDLS